MKRFLMVVMCFVMMFTFVLAGCGQQNANESTTAASGAETSATAQSEDTSIVTPGGTFPIVKPGNDITLKIFTSTRPGADDYNNNPFTDLVEKTMGIKLEFDVAEESESRQKLNLLMASGDYPEIIMGWLKPNNFSLAEQATYAEQGILIPLDDMIEKYGVGYKNMLSLYPAVADQFRLADGKVYTLPEVSECFHCLFAKKMWINKPWLDKLGLKEPTTTEEFYNVLKAFKTQDPNGNGKADEIPLAGSSNGWNAKPQQFLMYSFIYSDGFIKDGKYTVAFDKPEYKEGIKFMNRLVKEGLMAPESYTQKEDQLKLQVANDIIGATPTAWQGAFADTSSNDGPWTKWTCVEPLTGPAGVKQTWYNAYGVANPKAFITDKCKYPEVAFRFLDSFYMNDGNDPISLYRFFGGEKGVMWTDAKPGDLGVDGQPAKYAYTEAGMAPRAKNSWWDQIEPALSTNAMRNQWAQTPGTNPMETLLYNNTKKMEPYKPDIKTLIPPLVFSQDEATELGELGTTINNYVNEMLVKMVVSDSDIDKEWEKYVSELEKMDLKRFIEINQAAFDKRPK